MSKHQFALHLRGLPWSATLEQISEFMEGRAQPEVRVSKKKILRVLGSIFQKLEKCQN